jgi:probable phosphoglycerate mutase
MPPARSRDRSTLVLLVRHGQTPTTGKVVPGRAPGLHLADEGRRQADAVAKRIAGLPRVAAVYTSPLERARETAEPIAHARKLGAHVERGLNECDPGEWTGLTLTELRKRPEWQVVQHRPSAFRFPGGESFTGMQLRITSTIDRLVERHPGGILVAVSHADPIKAAVAHALGLHLDLFQRIVIAPCSITAVAWRPQGPMVLSMNAIDSDLGWMVPR